METTRKEIETGIDGIVDEYIIKLQEKKQDLLLALNRVELAIDSAESSKGYSNNSTIISGHPTPKKISPEELNRLKDAKGYDLFLWAMDRIGNEATVAEVYLEVSKLTIDNVRQRIGDNSLRQWLNVSGDALCKRGILKKEPRKDRKGGVIFRKV